MTKPKDVDQEVEMLDGVDPVVLQMFLRLPKHGSEWPLAERADWLRAMEGVLTMVYGRCDHVDIKETLIVADMIDEAPKKNVGGAPTTKNQRPAGIPSNLEMAIEGIEKAENKKASAPHLREFVRRTYWPDCPESWTASLYDFVKLKKLERDGLSFILPARTAPEAPVVKPVEPPKAPVVAPSPPPAPPPAPRPPAPQGMKFDYGDKACMLPSSRSYVLVGKLRNAMGKGHISEAFLAENVLGSNTEHNRTLARRLCLESNDELAKVGLKIENHPGYGLLMKDA